MQELQRSKWLMANYVPYTSLIKRLISILVVFLVAGYNVMGNPERPQSNATEDGNALADQSKMDLLQDTLQRATGQDEKFSIIKEIASLNNSLARKVLMDYYRTLPPSVSSTNPHSDFFKVGVFEVLLPLLDLDERNKFVESVLEDELINMRRANSQPLANMYPMSLWKKTIAAIEGNKDSRDRFSTIAKDDSLPMQVRSSALATSMRYDLEMNKDSEAQMIKDILENIPLKPEAWLPWKNYDNYEKRRAYYASDEYAPYRKRYLAWSESGKRVVFDGQFELLRSHGLKSVALIVSMLDRMDLSLERRHGLAEVAAKILARLKILSSQEREQADYLVRKLEIFIDKMPDKGAFCNRYYAILGLRSYYRNNGIEEGYPFKTGQLPKGSHSLSVPIAQVMATNRVSGSGLPASTNMHQKQDP